MGGFRYERPGVVWKPNPHAKFSVVYMSGLASDAPTGGSELLPLAASDDGLSIGVSLYTSDRRDPNWLGKPDPIAMAHDNAGIVTDLVRDMPTFFYGTSAGGIMAATAARLCQQEGLDVAGLVTYGMPTPARRRRLLPDLVRWKVPGGLVERWYSSQPSAVQDAVDDLLTLNELLCEQLPAAEVRRFAFSLLTFIRNGGNGEDLKEKSWYKDFQRVVLDYAIPYRAHVFPLGRMLNTLSCEQSFVGLSRAGVPVTLARGQTDGISRPDMSQGIVNACVRAGVTPPHTLDLHGFGHMSFNSKAPSMDWFRRQLMSASHVACGRRPEERAGLWSRAMDDMRAINAFGVLGTDAPEETVQSTPGRFARARSAVTDAVGPTLVRSLERVSALPSIRTAG